MTTSTDTTTLTATATATALPRERAAFWPIPQARILALDTTGVHSSAEPVAIAVTDTAGVVTFNALVLPEGEVDEEAAALHGLTRRVLERAGAPAFSEVYDRLAAALAGRTIATYNELFVCRILDRACLAGDLDFINLRDGGHDAMVRYVAYIAETTAAGASRFPRLPRSEAPGWRGPVRTCRDIALLLRVIAAGQEV